METKKIIWILNHHAVPPQYGGGTRHYDLGVELQKRGYEVFIFAAGFIHNSGQFVLDGQDLYKEEKMDGIHWIWIRTREYHSNGRERILSWVDYYRNVLKAGKNFGKADYIIGSAQHMLACIAAEKLAKRKKAVFISEIRDLWPETLICLGRLKRNSLTAYLLRYLEKHIYRRSKKIIVTAPGMKKYIMKMGIPENKITNINNGVNVALFDYNLKNYDCEDIGIEIKKDKFIILYAGAHGKANCLDVIVYADSKLKPEIRKNIEFVFIGDGPLKSNLIELSQKYELTNIRFYKTIGKQYIPSALSKSDCLILSVPNSSLYQYGISINKLYDYMCSGKPIILAAQTINDYVKESQCGISTFPEDPDEISQAIEQLYSLSEDKRKEMGMRGRAFVEKNFDISLLASRLEQVFI